jgi:hypothetical protein
MILKHFTTFFQRCKERNSGALVNARATLSFSNTYRGNPESTATIASRRYSDRVQLRRLPLKDIYEVLRAKKAQQAQLGEQIEALQAAAKEVEAVQHLLQDDDAPVPMARRAGNSL